VLWEVAELAWRLKDVVRVRCAPRCGMNHPLPLRHREGTEFQLRQATETKVNIYGLLLAANARTSSADVGNYNAGKTSCVELCGDQVGLKSCVRWYPVGTNGLPEGLSLHRVGRQSDVAPPHCAL
jgi:hypothetical protein